MGALLIAKIKKLFASQGRSWLFAVYRNLFQVIVIRCDLVLLVIGLRTVVINVYDLLKIAKLLVAVLI